jgi:hypothetical protein
MFQPETLVCFATHGLIAQMVEESTRIQEKLPFLSVLIASTPQLRGIECSSELWLPSQLAVKSFKELQPSSSSQWDINETELELQLKDTHLKLYPEGGYFEQTNSFSWLSLSQGLHSPIQHFERLSVGIPLSVKQVGHYHNLKPLHEGSFAITKSDGNVLFELDGSGACQLLIDLLKDRNPQFDAYAKVIDSDGSRKIYHITAGSPLYQGDRAPIVLNNADLTDAVSAELLIIDPDNAKRFSITDGLVLEAGDLERVDLLELENDTIYNDHIHFGSEKGYKINERMHSSLNETVQFHFMDHD